MTTPKDIKSEEIFAARLRDDPTTYLRIYNHYRYLSIEISLEKARLTSMEINTSNRNSFFSWETGSEFLLSVKLPCICSSSEPSKDLQISWTEIMNCGKPMHIHIKACSMPFTTTWDRSKSKTKNLEIKERNLLKIKSCALLKKELNQRRKPLVEKLTVWDRYINQADIFMDAIRQSNASLYNEGMESEGSFNDFVDVRRPFIQPTQSHAH